MIQSLFVIMAYGVVPYYITKMCIETSDFTYMYFPIAFLVMTYIGIIILWINIKLGNINVNLKDRAKK